MHSYSNFIAVASYRRLYIALHFIASYVAIPAMIATFKEETADKTLKRKISFKVKCQCQALTKRGKKWSGHNQTG